MMVALIEGVEQVLADAEVVSSRGDADDDSLMVLPPEALARAVAVTLSDEEQSADTEVEDEMDGNEEKSPVMDGVFMSESDIVISEERDGLIAPDDVDDINAVSVVCAVVIGDALTLTEKVKLAVVEGAVLKVGEDDTHAVALVKGVIVKPDDAVRARSREGLGESVAIALLDVVPVAWPDPVTPVDSVAFVVALTHDDGEDDARAETDRGSVSGLDGLVDPVTETVWLAVAMGERERTGETVPRIV